jgi:hypothetical protein
VDAVERKKSQQLRQKEGADHQMIAARAHGNRPIPQRISRLHRPTATLATDVPAHPQG